MFSGYTILQSQDATSYQARALEFRDSSLWDSAIYYFEKDIIAHKTTGDWEKSFEAQLLLNDSRIEALRFELADSALARLLIDASSNLSAWDVGVAKVLDLQGKVAIELGKYEEAVTKLQQSLAIRKHHKLHDDATGLTYYRLGDAWRSQGVIDSAMVAYKAALSIRENLYGLESEEVAAIWSNIAILHRITGDYQKAMHLYQKSDSILVKVYGFEHEKRAAVLNGLAIIHAQSARYPQALDHFNQLLKIDLKTQSGDSPTLAKTYTNLGILHELMGDLKAAQDYHKKSLSIKLKSFEPDNPNLIVDYQGLSVVLSHLGDLDQALLYQKQVVQMSEKAYNEVDPLRLGTSYNMLATSLMKKGEFDLALEYLGRAEQIFKLHGESLVELGPVYHTIASIYQLQNMNDSALSYGQKSLKTNMAFSDEHPHVAGNHSLIGNLHFANGSLEESKYHYNEALRINKIVYGEKHLAVANSFAKVGAVLSAEKKFNQALQQIQLGLLAVTNSFDHSNYQDNPLPSQTIMPRTVAAVLGEKGHVLKNYYDHSLDEELLKLAMATFSRAIEMIDAAQFSYKARGSVANLKEEFEAIFENAIAVAYKLYEQTKDEQYLDQAFTFFRKKPGCTVGRCSK